MRSLECAFNFTLINLREGSVLIGREGDEMTDLVNSGLVDDVLGSVGVSQGAQCFTIVTVCWRNGCNRKVKTMLVISSRSIE